MTTSATAVLRSFRRAPGLLVLALLVAASAVRPSTDLPALCDRAASEAAARSGVPLSVLRAITLAETGRALSGAFRPWPWTVNMEGAGHWFATRDEALAFVRKEYARGARSFDVGCFQINYKWHGQAFDSVEQMFDPEANAAYAAAFLRRLYESEGSWPQAAGAYHSLTPEFADRYRERFERIHAGLAGTPAPVVEIPDIVAAANRNAPPAPRENRFPLFIAGAPGSAGSLVPRGGAGVGPLFGAARPAVEVW